MSYPYPFAYGKDHDEDSLFTTISDSGSWILLGFRYLEYSDEILQATTGDKRS